MYDVMANIEMGFCALLLLTAWMAGVKASRLINSGSAARLHRKTRKLMLRAGLMSLPAIAVLVCIGWITATMPSLYWEDRVLLHGPLIVTPLLAVWFISVPKLWRFWKETGWSSSTLEGTVRGRLAGPGVVLPFQATAMAAATVFYLSWVSPISSDPLDVAVPLFLYFLAMAGLWMLHDRRWRRVLRPEALLAHSSWYRALRLLGIL
jgi:hypothetical protein